MSDKITVNPVKRNFTMISNAVLNDPAISFTAKGVLTYLIGKPPGWKMRVQDLMNHSNQGERSIRTALGELRLAGYASYLPPKEIGGQGEWKIDEKPIFSRRCCFSNGDNSNGENGPLSNTVQINNTEINNKSTIPSLHRSVKIPTRGEFEAFCDENISLVACSRDYDSIPWHKVRYSWESFLIGLEGKMETCRDRREQ